MNRPNSKTNYINFDTQNQVLSEDKRKPIINRSSRMQNLLTKLKQEKLKSKSNFDFSLDIDNSNANIEIANNINNSKQNIENSNYNNKIFDERSFKKIKEKHFGIPFRKKMVIDVNNNLKNIIRGNEISFNNFNNEKNNQSNIYLNKVKMDVSNFGTYNNIGGNNVLGVNKTRRRWGSSSKLNMNNNNNNSQYFLDENTEIMPANNINNLFSKKIFNKF